MINRDRRARLIRFAQSSPQHHDCEAFYLALTKKRLLRSPAPAGRHAMRRIANAGGGVPDTIAAIADKIRANL